VGVKGRRRARIDAPTCPPHPNLPPPGGKEHKRDIHFEKSPSMKEIKASVQPHKLSAVTLALRKAEGLTGMRVINVRGFGCGQAGRVWHAWWRRW
jgi:hypothetical protein